MVFPCHSCKIRGAMIGGGLSMDCFTFARGSHCKIYPASHLYTALIAMRDISRQIITLHLSLCICACVYLYIYVFMYLCICAFVYLYICIFVYLYLCICVFVSHVQTCPQRCIARSVPGCSLATEFIRAKSYKLDRISFLKMSWEFTFIPITGIYSHKTLQIRTVSIPKYVCGQHSKELKASLAPTI